MSGSMMRICFAIFSMPFSTFFPEYHKLKLITRSGRSVISAGTGMAVTTAARMKFRQIAARFCQKDAPDRGILIRL